MLSESIFTVHKFKIAFQSYNEPIYLIPIGDIHKGSRLHHKEKWQEFLDWAKTKKNLYLVGMGDYQELNSHNERRAILGANFHESTLQTLDDIYLKETEEFVNDLKPFKGRIIGLIEGNHHGCFQSGVTTTQKACELLGCKYLGISTFIRLTFSHGTKNASIDIFAHHGKGASKLVGGSLSTIQGMVHIAEADIYLMSHDHKKSVGMANRLVLNEGKGSLAIKNKKLLFARCGSFLKGYQDNEPSYVSAACLYPTDLGVVKIELTPKRDRKMRDNGKQDDDLYIDIHASL